MYYDNNIINLVFVLIRYEAATSQNAKRVIAKETGVKGHCAVERLPNYLGISECSQPDGMHTVKDFVENIFKLVNGVTDSPAVRAEESNLGRFDQVNHLLSIIVHRCKPKTVSNGSE